MRASELAKTFSRNIYLLKSKPSPLGRFSLIFLHNDKRTERKYVFFLTWINLQRREYMCAAPAIYEGSCSHLWTYSVVYVHTECWYDHINLYFVCIPVEWRQRADEVMNVRSGGEKDHVQLMLSDSWCHSATAGVIKSMPQVNSGLGR